MTAAKGDDEVLLRLDAIEEAVIELASHVMANLGRGVAMSSPRDRFKMLYRIEGDVKERREARAAVLAAVRDEELAAARQRIAERLS
jgi:hypothetical protein